MNQSENFFFLSKISNKTSVRFALSGPFQHFLIIFIIYCFLHA